MSEYPYINTTGKLREFVSKIGDMGVPSSVTLKWLPTVGFGSTNHRPILKILRFIGFVDINKPTQRWQRFRDSTQSSTVMAEAIREGYALLFSLYPDAYSRSDEDLKNFFKGQMSGGDQVISKTVATFRSLCSFADFEEPIGHDVSHRSTPMGSDAKRGISGESMKYRGDQSLPLHLNIEIHISADAPHEQIDHIFLSMARHLYGRKTSAELEKDYE